jgi:H+/Cl- antiporter ClcA
MNILLEATLVGIICTIIGSIVFTAVAHVIPRKDQAVAHVIPRKEQLVQLVISLFLTGFLGHLFLEETGLNRQLYKATGFWLW